MGCGRAYCPVVPRDPNLVRDAGIRKSKLIGIGEDFELEASARRLVSPAMDMLFVPAFLLVILLTKPIPSIDFIAAAVPPDSRSTTIESYNP